MHLSQAHAFAYQPFIHVLNQNPLYSGHPIAYPFATNWLTGLLIRVGVDVVTAFVTPTIIITLCLLLSLYVFGKLLTQSAAATLLGLSLFFLSGGIEFYYYFSDLSKDFSIDKIFYPLRHYSFLEEYGYYWKSVILASLIPQRALLFGIPCMLFSLSYLFYHYRTEFDNARYSRLFAVGLATGMLAIVHTHSLLVLFLICCCLFVTDLKHNRYWICFAIGVACTAIPWLPFLIGSNASGFVEYFPGWYSNASRENEFLLWFWFKNWGFFFPLSIVSLLWLFVGRCFSTQLGTAESATLESRVHLSDGKVRTVYLAFSMLFVLANLFKFQPNLWDNTKILLWANLGLSFLVAQFLVTNFKRGLFAKGACITFVILMTLTGLIDLVKSLHIGKESHVMLSKEQMRFAQDLRDISNPTDLMLTPDYHLHFVSTMSGRSILMGYRGWLWTYNIDYKQREQDVKKIYSGAPDAKALLDKYGIKYIVVDKLSIRDFGADRAFFQNNFKKVLSSQWGEIYHVR